MNILFERCHHYVTNVPKPFHSTKISMEQDHESLSFPMLRTVLWDRRPIDGSGLSSSGDTITSSGSQDMDFVEMIGPDVLIPKVKIHLKCISMLRNYLRLIPEHPSLMIGFAAAETEYSSSSIRSNNSSISNKSSSLFTTAGNNNDRIGGIQADRSPGIKVKEDRTMMIGGYWNAVMNHFDSGNVAVKKDNERNTTSSTAAAINTVVLPKPSRDTLAKGGIMVPGRTMMMYIFHKVSNDEICPNEDEYECMIRDMLNRIVNIRGEFRGDELFQMYGTCTTSFVDDKSSSSSSATSVMKSVIERLTIRVETILPCIKFAFTRISNLPIYSSQLSRFLIHQNETIKQSSKPITTPYPIKGEVKTGFITLNKVRKAVLLLEDDRNAYKIPLVGIWIKGNLIFSKIRSNKDNSMTWRYKVHDPAVYACCLRYLLNQHVKEKVSPPESPGTFLVMLISEPSDDRIEEGCEYLFLECRPLGFDNRTICKELVHYEAQMSLDDDILESSEHKNDLNRGDVECNFHLMEDSRAQVRFEDAALKVFRSDKDKYKPFQNIVRELGAKSSSADDLQESKADSLLLPPITTLPVMPDPFTVDLNTKKKRIASVEDEDDTPPPPPPPRSLMPVQETSSSNFSASNTPDVSNAPMKMQHHSYLLNSRLQDYLREIAALQQQIRNIKHSIAEDDEAKLYSNNDMVLSIGMDENESLVDELIGRYNHDDGNNDDIRNERLSERIEEEVREKSNEGDDFINNNDNGDIKNEQDDNDHQWS